MLRSLSSDGERPSAESFSRNRLTVEADAYDVAVGVASVRYSPSDIYVANFLGTARARPEYLPRPRAITKHAAERGRDCAPFAPRRALVAVSYV